FEGLDAEAAKTTDRIEVIWVNLANPLFAAGALLALLGIWRVASALAIVGLASASYWLYAGDITALRIPRLEPDSFAIGYWLWLGSFGVLAAAALGGTCFARD